MDDNARGIPYQEEELAAIREVVATVQRSQQNERVDEFVGLFHPDAVWTTAHGRRLTGRAEVEEFTARVLPGATREVAATYEVAHVLFIRPDVAAVKVRQREFSRASGEYTGQEGSPLYVMSKEDGRWLLTAGQNTLVLDG
ncbi:SgcJ/EcaC family oxidoreductase [Streptomyces sp. NPDC005438]|uniref:SgcJ/EcaC family oxidoreductase n=1 Tax=Streptomyces sp. NPDC005438 TaxID=3156880 RepID=UPI0033AB0D41